jgi:hypothetical protein
MQQAWRDPDHEGKTAVAVKRGRSQARRSGSNRAGLPGWAWMILGINGFFVFGIYRHSDISPTAFFT